MKKVSIIIACKNTAENIEQCLLSIKNQTYKNIELIIVDNFSSDGTYEIAKKYADQIYQIGPERSTQFNFGFKHSNGEYIYRIGPDYVLEHDLIEKCVAKIAEGYDALALHNRSVGESIWARVRYIERERYRNDSSIVAVRFMRREVFESVGMFDETLVAGEDFDLHNRIVRAGYKWTHVDAIENHIGEPKNIVDVWRKFYYYGRTIRRYQQKNKEVAKQQLVFFRPAFKKIQAELRKSPKLLIAFYVYMFVKYLAGFIGMVRGAPDALKDTIVKANSGTNENVLVILTHPTPPYTGGSFAVTEESLRTRVNLEQSRYWFILDRENSHLETIRGLVFQSFRIPKIVPFLESKNLLIARVLELILTPIIIFRAAKRIIKRENISIIYLPIGELPILYISAYFLKRIYSVRVVALIHQIRDVRRLDTTFFKDFFAVRAAGKSFSTSLGIALATKFILPIGKHILASFDVIATVSNLVAGRLNRLLRGGKFTVLRFGFDYSEYDTTKKSSKIYQAVFVGRLSENKGILDLIHVWEQVVRHKPDAKFLIIGDGEAAYVEFIKQIVGKKSLTKNIVFAGLQRGKDKIQLMKSSEIFLFLSPDESQPLVIDEAIACGLPLVTYDLEVYRNRYIYTDAFFPFPKGDDQAIVGKILELISGPTRQKSQSNLPRLPNWNGFIEAENRLMTQAQSHN